MNIEKKLSKAVKCSKKFVHKTVVNNNLIYKLIHCYYYTYKQIIINFVVIYVYII